MSEDSKLDFSSGAPDPGFFESLDPSRPIQDSNAIAYQWKSAGKFGFLLFFALFWNAIVGSFIFAMITGQEIKLNGVAYTNYAEALRNDPTGYVFILFPIFGMGLFYVAAALLFNSTKFELEGDILFIRRGPIPWWRKTAPLNRAEILSARAEEYVSHHHNDRPVRQHRVKVLLRDTKEERIVESYMAAREAKFLAYWIGRRMKLSHRGSQLKVG